MPVCFGNTLATIESVSTQIVLLAPRSHTLLSLFFCGDCGDGIMGSDIEDVSVDSCDLVGVVGVGGVGTVVETETESLLRIDVNNQEARSHTINQPHKQATR